jgi:hypothetical protein
MVAKTLPSITFRLKNKQTKARKNKKQRKAKQSKTNKQKQKQRNTDFKMFLNKSHRDCTYI